MATIADPTPLRTVKPVDVAASERIEHDRDMRNNGFLPPVRTPEDRASRLIHSHDGIYSYSRTGRVRRRQAVVQGQMFRLVTALAALVAALAFAFGVVWLPGVALLFWRAGQ